MSSIADYHLHGFDVSHWQAGHIDFAVGGRIFCHIKATEADRYVDPTFRQKRDDAHAEGMRLVGLYHFAKPAVSSAHAQADHFLQTVGALRPGEVLVLDFEDAWDEAWAVEFIQRCQATGATVIFYSYRAMLSAHGHDAIKATGAPLWIAAYSSDPAKANVAGWPWTFWQHTNGQTAADGPYDCSVFHTNNLDELVALAGGTTQPPQGEDDMAPAQAITYPGAGGIWASNGLEKFGYATPKELQDAANNGTIQTVAGTNPPQPDIKVFDKGYVDRLRDVNVDVQFDADIAAIAQATVTKLADALGAHG